MSNSPSATFFEPSNIKCSKRCANPVRPRRSLAEPDVVPDVDGDDRHARVAMQNHVQPVGERTAGTEPRARAGCAAAAALQSPSALRRARASNAGRRRIAGSCKLTRAHRSCGAPARATSHERRGDVPLESRAHERHGTSFRHRTLARDVLRHPVPRAAAAPFLRAVRAARHALLRRRRARRQSRALLAAARRARRRDRAASRTSCASCAGSMAATTASRSCRRPSAASPGYAELLVSERTPTVTTLSQRMGRRACSASRALST